MTLHRWIRAGFLPAAMAALYPGTGSAQTLPTDQPPVQVTTQPSLQDPATILQSGDPAITQNLRYLAAIRLIGSQTPQARATITDLLTRGTPLTQATLARALASMSWPDADFAEPLTVLLRGRDQTASAAAAAALAQYKDNIDVLQELINQAKSDRPANVRVPVIRALGAFDQKPAAQTLIDLQQHDEDDQIEAAAGDALIDMTGLSNFDHDPNRWAQWWQQNQGLSEEDFRLAIIRGRGQAFDALAQQRKTLESASDELLTDNYWKSRPQDRGPVLMSYLQSPAPEIRALGADLVLLTVQASGSAPPGAIRQTRLLLSDPSADVRSAAATALSADFDSAPDLVSQLTREQDDVVRTHLINTLAPFENLQAIEQMLHFVAAGTSPAVRIAAANGIRQGGDIIDKDPALHSKAIGILIAALHDTDAPGLPMLREAVVGALAAMREGSLSQLFLQLLQQSEPLGVRAKALVGLGSLPDPTPYAAEIARHLDEEEPAMRLAAVQAMGLAPAPMAPPYIDQLLTRMSQDDNDQVRSEAWNVVQNWVQSPAIDESTLAGIADELSHDRNKALEVRERLRDRLAQDAQSNPDPAKRQAAAQQCALQQQDIGDLLMDPQINHPSQAAEQYRAALDYWKAHGGAVDVISRLCKDVVDSLLDADRWDEASGFASTVLRDWGSDPHLKVTTQTVGREFVVEAENLANSDDPNAYGDSMELFDAIGKMNPQLPSDYLDQLHSLQTEIEAKHAAASKPAS